MLARHVIPAVEEALEFRPAVMILGPRQTGKSTLAEAIARADKNRRYVTFDEPNAHMEAKRDPGAFLDTYGTPLILDEVQRVPEIFVPIKLRVDRNRVPGSYLLTGSANVLVLPKVADSLAGRVELIDLLPLTQAEIEGKTGNFVDNLFESGVPNRGEWASETPLLERIFRGGFPEPAVQLPAKHRRKWFDSYIRSLMDKDVRDIANIDGLTQMPRLLQLLATRNGWTLNIASLSREVGIPHTTLTRYLDLLRALFMLQDVPAWSANVGTRLTKASKVYIIDPALAAHLSYFDPRQLEVNRYAADGLIEGFVANELARLISQSESKPWLMHLRTVKQKEVAFVLESRDGRVIGIEVKSAKSVQPADAEGLRYLAELAGDRFHGGIVLYDGTDAVPIGPKITALPFAALWGV